jgi:Peptidase A4 family
MTDKWNPDVARKSLLEPQLPPPGLDLAAASESDRVHYGFPAMPDRQTQPRLWAKWEANLHRPWRRVVPEYELHPARLVHQDQSTAGNSPNWSGAIAAPPAGDVFNAVVGTWVVPDAYPPPSAWNGRGYNNGLYNALHWVGIDGWTGAGVNDVLQAGTGTDVNVVNGAISVSPYFWYEWWYGPLNNGFATLQGFTVTPGDVVTVTVCVTGGSRNSGVAIIGNVTRQEYTTQAIADPSSKLTLTGNTAEWIVERKGVGQVGQFATLANYGAAFFSDCQASGTGFEVDLSAATMLPMVVGGATVSSALEVSSSVLECYYGTQKP